MRTRTIRISGDVLAVLRQHKTAGDSMNDVVRNLLGLPRLTPGVGPTTPYGAIGPLLRAGLLRERQVLVWHRRRLGESHTATIDTHGRLITEDGSAWPTPNMAASAIAGYPCKGWSVWRTADGSTLADLRDRLGADLPSEQATPNPHCGDVT